MHTTHHTTHQTINHSNSLATELALYLADVAAQPGAFNWSTNNCCHFAGRWVRWATGFDPLSGLADVADAYSAGRLLRAIGGGGLAAAVTTRMQRPPLLPSLAQVGDVVLMHGVAETAVVCSMLGAALGICAGRTAVFIDLAGCCQHMPMVRAAKAWPLSDRAVAVAA